METVLLTIAILGLAIAGMAVGVIFSNRRLKGSCGGLNRVMGEDCDFCDKKSRCIEEDRCVGEDEEECSGRDGELKKPALSKSIS